MMAIGIIGAVVQGIGAIATASANASAAAYNEQVDQRNEQIALSQGEAQAQQQQRENEQQLGRLQAEYGAAGINMTSGDALGVFQDSATQANYDLAKTRYDAKLRSIGYADQANLDSMQEQSWSTAGMLGVVNAGVGVGDAILKAA